jgi:chorismate mutase
MSSLDDLRRRINELDRQILELVGKRQETSREVARAKRATGQATRDYNREREGPARGPRGGQADTAFRRSSPRTSCGS